MSHTSKATSEFNLCLYVNNVIFCPNQSETTFKITQTHSLNYRIHSSDSLRQDQQLPIRHVIQSWTRVAGQHHLNHRRVADLNLLSKCNILQSFELLTSVPRERSSLTKGITPRMMSTPLLSTKNKAHLWGGPCKRKPARTVFKH